MNVEQNMSREVAFAPPPRGRMRRYILAGVVGCACVWGAAYGYLALLPPSYTGSFVLVMPGTGAGSTLNLATLGQATSTASSPFASPELSPTENYRKMLIGEHLRKAAAGKVGEDPERFPIPRVDLADQTKLITVKLTGRTPEQAAGRAMALKTAFDELLDALRRDEIATRNAAFREMLGAYKTAVNEARQKLTDYQAATGLVSVDQFATMVGGLEHLREILRDVEAKEANLRAAVAELTRQLGVSAEQANVALVLRSDPMFQALVEQAAKQDAEMATLTGTRGGNNPRVQDLQAELANTLGRLTARAAELTGAKRPDVLRLRDLSVHEERARLFERLVGQIADAEAMAAMHARLAAQIEAEQARVIALSSSAARLDDLRRDVQVADAVLSSALARTDTSKADYYASYPMVQTLEMPEVPPRPSAPLPLLALAGGLAATLLILFALVLTWLRTALFQRILKNA